MPVAASWQLVAWQNCNLSHREPWPRMLIIQRSVQATGQIVSDCDMASCMAPCRSAESIRKHDRGRFTHGRYSFSLTLQKLTRRLASAPRPLLVGAQSLQGSSWQATWPKEVNPALRLAGALRCLAWLQAGPTSSAAWTALPPHWAPLCKRQDLQLALNALPGQDQQMSFQLQAQAAARYHVPGSAPHCGASRCPAVWSSQVQSLCCHRYTTSCTPSRLGRTWWWRAQQARWRPSTPTAAASPPEPRALSCSGVL
jgi:hypothetical protein